MESKERVREMTRLPLSYMPNQRVQSDKHQEIKSRHGNGDGDYLRVSTITHDYKHNTHRRICI